MAKRFTDTEKWKKAFIRSLPSAYKLLWLYILDDCDRAGLWHVDFEIARIKTGEKTIKEERAVELFNKDCKDGEQRVIVIQDGKKWYIREFNDFQYGQLTPKNRMHVGIIESLDKYGLLSLSPILSPLQGVKDKDKDMEQDRDKDKDKDKTNPHTSCITIYHNWYLDRFKMKPQIDGGDAKAMKLILDYLRKNSETDDQAILTWQAVLTNYDRWSKFYKPQTRIRQINTFLSNIITELKIKIDANKSFADSVESRFTSPDTTSHQG